jgi:hypothetical protein
VIDAPGRGSFVSVEICPEMEANWAKELNESSNKKANSVIFI